MNDILTVVMLVNFERRNLRNFNWLGCVVSPITKNFFAISLDDNHCRSYWHDFHAWFELDSFWRDERTKSASFQVYRSQTQNPSCRVAFHFSWRNLVFVCKHVG